MASLTREELATEVSSDLLSDLRTIAESEGMRVDALVEEALADLIEKRKRSQPRSHVMEAYRASHDKLAPLYKKLAE